MVDGIIIEVRRDNGSQEMLLSWRAVILKVKSISEIPLHVHYFHTLIYNRFRYLLLLFIFFIDYRLKIEHDFDPNVDTIFMPNGLGTMFLDLIHLDLTKFAINTMVEL